MKADLTIAIPTLNCLRTLRSTLESLRALREDGARVVVVDSDSTDGTAAYARQMDLEVLNVAKGNMYVAVNAGLRTARSQWLTYLNGDDLLYADAVKAALAGVPPDADLLYGDVDFIDYHGRFIHGVRAAPAADLAGLACRLAIPICQPGAMFRQRVFTRLGGFDTTFYHSADYDFFVRALAAGFNFWRLRRPSIAAFRIHATQFSQHFQAVQAAEALTSLRRSSLRVAWPRRTAAFLRFRARNWRNYLVRWLRGYELSGSLRLPRCLEVQPTGALERQPKSAS